MLLSVFWVERRPAPTNPAPAFRLQNFLYYFLRFGVLEHLEKLQRPSVNWCLITKSCLTLCDPMDCSPPGSSVREISQTRTLEWIAIPFLRGASQPRDQTHVSCMGRQMLYHWAIYQSFWLVPWTVDKRSEMSLPPRYCGEQDEVGILPIFKSVHQWHRLAGVSCVFFWSPPPLHMAILSPWAQILPDPGVGTWPQLGQPEPFHGVFGSGTLGAVSLFPLDFDEKQWSPQVRNKDPGEGYQSTFQSFWRLAHPPAVHIPWGNKFPTLFLNWFKFDVFFFFLGLQPSVSSPAWMMIIWMLSVNESKTWDQLIWGKVGEQWGSLYPELGT